MIRILFNMITLKLLLIHRGDDSVSKLLIEKEQELGFSLAEPTQSWEWEYSPESQGSYGKNGSKVRSFQTT